MLQPRRPTMGALTLPIESDQKPVRAGADVDDYVADAVSGDVQAFEALYRLHLPRIHSLVRRMTAGRDADEVTQDVFVRAWQKMATFRGASSFGTWLHRLAVNVVIERFRAETTRRRRLVEGDALFEQIPALPRHDDLAMDFETALMNLPDGARRVFVLHDVQGYKHHEIATLLEISSGTSKAQLHRARMLLRRHLLRRAPGSAAE